MHEAASNCQRWQKISSKCSRGKEGKPDAHFGGEGRSSADACGGAAEAPPPLLLLLLPLLLLLLPLLPLLLSVPAGAECECSETMPLQGV